MGIALEKDLDNSTRRVILEKGMKTYLSTALDDIKWAHSGVGKTAGEDTSNHALGIVGHVMNVTHILLICLKSQFCL